MSNYFQASGVKSGQRLAEYLKLAENGLWATLNEQLDRFTEDAAAHPNAVILAAVTILVASAKGRGQSAVPLVEAYIAHLNGGKSAEARAAELGLRLPKQILE